MSEDTVAALATAAGNGAIACIRVSGTKAFDIVSEIFVTGNGKNLTETVPGMMRLGNIVDNNELIDEVLAVRFKSPNSYTGEDTVEINCHGSQYIIRKTLSLLIEHGCRAALPGEFTQRAFLNGKLDLSQAEAVADLIASSSAASHRLAMNQMRGGFSSELNSIRLQLLDFVSLIELELDFGEEDVEFADRTKLMLLVSDIRTGLSRLVQSFHFGNAIKNGIPVAIVGETNVGKSTLLNILLNEERAIVSDIHGTTRDTIEDVININGVAFRFIDTAGIRDTGDEIEYLGISRTFQKIEQAEIVLWIIDVSQNNDNLKYIADRIVPKIKDKTLIMVFNKIDRIDFERQTAFSEKFLPQLSAERICVSAKYKQNTDALEKALLKAAALPDVSENDVIITNTRHYEALSKALEAVCRVAKGLETNISGDFLSQDIRECMNFLGEITGEITTDEVLGNIFGKFCIGK